MNQDNITPLRQLIKEKPYLIWYTQSHDQLDLEPIAEAIYNYGDWEDVKLLHQTLSVPTAAKVFYKLASAKRSNLHKLARNYFTLYYQRYA